MKLILGLDNVFIFDLDIVTSTFKILSLDRISETVRGKKLSHCRYIVLCVGV